MTRVDELYAEGEKLKDENKLEEAIAKFEECLSDDETFALGHFALAVCLGRVGRHEDAVRHGQRAVELEPDDAFSYTAMSVTYQRAFAGTQNGDYIRLAEDAMAKAHEIQSRG